MNPFCTTTNITNYFSFWAITTTITTTTTTSLLPALLLLSLISSVLYCLFTTTMTSLTYIINLAIINLLGVVHHWLSAWPSLLRLLILFFVAAVASRRLGRRLCRCSL